MEKLNTHEGLYSLLVRSLDRYDAAAAHSSALSDRHSLPEQQDDHECVDGYTVEAVRVGRSLRRDFEKAGIHLPEHQRDRLVELTGLERRLGIAIGICAGSSHTQRHLVHSLSWWQASNRLYLHSLVRALLAGHACLPCPNVQAASPVRQEPHHDHVSCAGQNLSDASKLGCVDLDVARKGAGESGLHNVQEGASRRVALETSMLNYVLQEDSNARNRQSVRLLCL